MKILQQKKNKIFIQFDPCFPKKKLVKIMKPYLTVYFMGTKSLITNQKKYYQNLLFDKLVSFYLYNPQFSEIKYTVKNPNLRDSLKVTNDSHLNFHKERIIDFLTSHKEKTPNIDLEYIKLFYN